jgi:guanylate cyclase
MISPFQKIVTKIARIGTNTDDSADLKLKKSLLALFSVPFMIAGAGWGVMYVAFDETQAGLIPISYSIISFFSFLHFKVTKRFDIFRFSQLFLILLLPFALMIALGGFVNGSAVILWSLISPLGAMLFSKQSSAPRWFFAFILLVTISGILQPLLNFKNNFSSVQITLFFVINLIGVGYLIFQMVYYFVGKKNLYEERSEALLLNILPKKIVEILREEHRTIAEHFEGASILFADVENFTSMSARMTPTELVELLNEVFSKFDKLADKYGLEKIKTIGDCYMVAAGVPYSRKDHAHLLTDLAIEMRNYVSQNEFMGKKLRFRFGINSGPVIAGVIGQKKFSYDLWGDTVNIASRMESHGSGGVIQITQATFSHIKDEFICIPQGTLNVKGKGEMNVWYVSERKNPIEKN